MNLGTHKGPHGDEFCAFALLMRYNPNYRNAKIITYGSKDEALASAKRDKVTLIGIGEGALDEHGKEGQECAASLAARQLRLEDDLKFFRLLEEVRSCDLAAKARRTHIPELLKILYDHHPEADVIAWGLRAYTTLVEACETGNLSPQATDVLEEVSVELAGKYAGTNQSESMRRSWLDCQAAVNNSRGSLTELRTVADLISLSSRDEAVKWARMGIEALFHRQLDFERAVEEVQKGYRFVAPWSRLDRGMTCRGQYHGVAIYSNNSQSIRAFRSNRVGNLDLLIVRNKSGNVQVFSNAKSRIPMVSCVKALRHAEALKRGVRLDINDLGQEGDCPAVPQWYYFAKGGMVMNGSKSHPGIEVTALTDYELLEAVQGAFKQATGSSELRNSLFKQ